MGFSSQVIALSPSQGTGRWYSLLLSQTQCCRLPGAQPPGLSKSTGFGSLFSEPVRGSSSPVLNSTPRRATTPDFLKIQSWPHATVGQMECYRQHIVGAGHTYPPLLYIMQIGLLCFVTDHKLGFSRLFARAEIISLIPYCAMRIA